MARKTLLVVRYPREYVEFITDDIAELVREYCNQRPNTDLVFASSSLSNVPCLRNSSINVMVTSFSLSFDSCSDIGAVTPRYLFVLQFSVQRPCIA